MGLEKGKKRNNVPSLFTLTFFTPYLGNFSKQSTTKNTSIENDYSFSVFALSFVHNEEKNLTLKQDRYRGIQSHLYSLKISMVENKISRKRERSDCAGCFVMARKVPGRQEQNKAAFLIKHLLLCLNLF